MGVDKITRGYQRQIQRWGTIGEKSKIIQILQKKGARKCFVFLHRYSSGEKCKKRGERVRKEKVGPQNLTGEKTGGLH